MEIDFDRSRPIYQQIIEEIKKMIVRGELQPGNKLHSQRKMAQKMDVNPNTVQRAYREMERKNLIETKRGRGTFIIDDREVVQNCKREMVNQAVMNFLEEMVALDLETEEIIKELKNEIIIMDQDKEIDSKKVKKILSAIVNSSSAEGE